MAISAVRAEFGAAAEFALGGDPIVVIGAYDIAEGDVRFRKRVVRASGLLR